MPALRSLPSGTGRLDGMRHALFGTLPGRAIVIGIVLRLAVYATGIALGSVPPFLAVIDTAAGLALAVGAVYVVVKLVALGKRHLLWRVRRKLMLSYVFVGVFPAALIAVFFLLCGFLLFYNFSSYLVQSHLRGIADQARFMAQSTALEIQRNEGRNIAGIIERRRANASGEFAGVSLAVVPTVRLCGAGSGRDGRVMGPREAADVDSGVDRLRRDQRRRGLFLRSRQLVFSSSGHPRPVRGVSRHPAGELRRCRRPACTGHDYAPAAA